MRLALSKRSDIHEIFLQFLLQQETLHAPPIRSRVHAPNANRGPARRRGHADGEGWDMKPSDRILEIYEEKLEPNYTQTQKCAVYIAAIIRYLDERDAQSKSISRPSSNPPDSSSS